MKRLPVTLLSVGCLSIFILLLIVLFLTPLTSSIMVGGDLSYMFPQMLSSYTIYPYAWDWNSLSGLGSYVAPLLGVHFSIIIIPILGSMFHLSQAVIYRISYVIPFLLISSVSSMLFLRHFLRKLPLLLSIIGSLIFISNTYVFMVLGGGNFLIVMAYSFVPLLFTMFDVILERLKSRSPILEQKIHISPWFLSLLFGFLLSLQFMFDMRIWVVTILGLIGFYIFSFSISLAEKGRSLKSELIHIFFLFVLPVGLLLGLNIFWILPSLIVHINPLVQLGSAYVSNQAVSFFSVADFPHTISLLHPNWPENIFGKVYFLQPEFLILPLLAFGSLLFLQNQKLKQYNNRTMLYFALLGLLGAFLAKGTNDPFGSLYVWMFQHVPGFNIFRDPTKWYVLIAISYMILIPYCLSKVIETIRCVRLLKKVNTNIPYLIVSTLFIVFWLFTLREAVSGTLNGTFASHQVPADYIHFQNFISEQPEYFRTLWLPTTQRYGYFTAQHPQISGKDFFKRYDLNSLLAILGKNDSEEAVRDSAVKYIVVPEDSEKEIFLTKGKYDEYQYASVIAALEKIPWLHEKKKFGKIVIFLVQSNKQHAFIVQDNNTKNSQAMIQMMNPTSYQVALHNVSAGNLLVFSEAFDPNWHASIVGEPSNDLKSASYEGALNSFTLPKSGTYTLSLNYQPQKLVDIGIWISLVVGVTSMLLLVGSAVLIFRNP